jgi:hypothetical protein
MNNKEIAKLTACRLKGHRITNTNRRYCDTCFQRFLISKSMGTSNIQIKREFLQEYFK